MKTHLYLLLLAAGISAASQMSSMAELLTLLQQMQEVMAKDIQNQRIETPDNINIENLGFPKSQPSTELLKLIAWPDGYCLFPATDGRVLSFFGSLADLFLNKPTLDAKCISTIFEGTERLKTNPAMKKFSAFFQNFERLKQFLTPSLAKEGKCDTERRNATIFIKKLMTFIQKALKPTRA